ncbi:universal stress protein [Rhodococcus sp. IEGM 1318]|uniref:universal stress protein n=1 Tax=Rhodococcus sp. IEGM 1318 TaxID=3082226 RepID=UPI002955BAA3|nr:hypothetical protein [Rhodococcus sp. IEGM 1318]MDV8008682.1 hypothetical protein [Rhodococcus sp. IEGM 1318]
MTDHENGRCRSAWRTFEPIHIDGPASPHPPRCELVVGLDAHPGIHPALPYAIAFARQLDAGLHVVHSIDPADYPIEPDSPHHEQEFADTLESECTEPAPHSHHSPGPGPTTSPAKTPHTTTGHYRQRLRRHDDRHRNTAPRTHFDLRTPLPKLRRYPPDSPHPSPATDAAGTTSRPHSLATPPTPAH